MTTKSNAPLIGGAGGAALGFFLAGPIGAVLGGSVGYLGGRKARGDQGMTPERKRIYEAALKEPPEPLKLRKLADAFEAYGLKEEAELLRKRAILRELPAEQKAARRDAFRKFLKVKDPEVVEKAAAIYHQQGATGNAAQLREHAAALRKIAAGLVKV